LGPWPSQDPGPLSGRVEPYPLSLQNHMRWKAVGELAGSQLLSGNPFGRSEGGHPDSVQALGIRKEEPVAEASRRREYGACWCRCSAATRNGEGPFGGTLKGSLRALGREINVRPPPRQMKGCPVSIS